MDPETKIEEPVKESRLKKLAMPALITAVFVVPVACNVVSAYLGWKTVNAQITLETMKAAAKQ